MRVLWRFLLVLAAALASLTLIAILLLLLPVWPEPDFELRKGSLQSSRETGSWQVDGGQIVEVQLESSSGLQAELALRLPDQPLPERPLLIMLSGQETGRKAVFLRWCRLVIDRV